MEQVNVYGAEWCGDTQAALALLEELGVPYQFRDVDEDLAADNWVRIHNDGKQKLPTVRIGDQVLSVPSETELESALRGAGLAG
jgi:glutaredoxin